MRMIKAWAPSPEDEIFVCGQRFAFLFSGTEQERLEKAVMIGLAKGRLEAMEEMKRAVAPTPRRKRKGVRP